MTKQGRWPGMVNPDIVEGLLLALQHVLIEYPARQKGSPPSEITAPDVANALIRLLASVLERSPSCDTPAGMRRMGEVAGVELVRLMKGGRAFREAAMASRSDVVQ